MQLLHLNLGRVELGDEIGIESDAPSVIHVEAGQPFTVGFTYKLIEMSADEDQWQLKLSTTINGEATRSDETIIHDRRHMLDDHWSNMRQSHTLDAPGTHVLEFDYSAHLERRAWGTDQLHTAVDDERHQGTVEIIVA